MSETELSRRWQLESQIEKCTSCNLSELEINNTNYSKYHGKYFCYGDLNPQVVFIGIAPSFNRTQEKKNDQFPYEKVKHKDRSNYVMRTGFVGSIIKRAINHAGIKEAKIMFTNILKCSTLNNAQPTNKQAGACFKYLHAELKVARPKVICTLGKFPANFLIKGRYKMYEFAMPLDDFSFSLKIMPLYHPVYVHNKGKLEFLNFSNAIKKAFKLAKGQKELF